jgi:hypothetical protein
MNLGFWVNVTKKAEAVLCKPTCLYPWDEIVHGVMVCRSDGSSERMVAVAQNTWRAHHRQNTKQTGSSDVYKHYFVANKNDILSELFSVRDRDSLHALENRLALNLKPLLSNLKPHLLNSYNSIRKPIDLYLQSLVAMAQEVTEEARMRLIPLMFLALDSQMLGPFRIHDKEEFSIFSYGQLRKYGLTPKSSYGHIKTEETYIRIQDIVTNKAKEIADSCGQSFYPVYFELLWNRRYSRTGRNLFELNP